jgi:hypothetical protein
MSSLPRRICFLVLTLALVVGRASADDADEQRDGVTDAANVQLAVRIDAHYSDDPASIAQLRQLLDFLPPESAQLRAQEDIHRFVIRRYGFGPYKQPDARHAFFLLRDYIADHNHLSPYMTGPRTIRVPPLPPRQKLFVNRAKRTNRLPKLQTLESFYTSGLAFMVRPVNQLDDSAREGSRSVVLDVRVTAQQARLLATTAFFNTSAVSADVHPVVASFGGTCNEPLPTRTTPLLTPSEQSLITERVNTAHGAELFILDTGWPSAPEMAYAISRAGDALKQWRLDLGLPAEPLATVTFHAPPLPLRHCEDVATSLAELRALDPTRRAVDVIYFPITIQQDTVGFFRNLLEVSYVAERVNTIGTTKTNAASLYARAVTNAAWVLDDIQKQLQTDPSGFITNKAILDGLYRLADYISGRNNSLHVVNASWGLPAKLLKLLPEFERGLTVVAAGNDNEEYPGSEIDLARHCVENGRYLGVVNMDRNGRRLFCSGHIKTGYEAKASSVGFDGIISGSCGTSFAAPRVAFLVALAASQLQTPDLSSWFLDLEARAASASATHLLDIPALLK